MPTIKRFHRCRIEMYFGDHNPPHVHVITLDEQRVAVAIDTLRILAGKANRRDIAEALEWARAHKDLLADHWTNFSETDR